MKLLKDQVRHPETRFHRLIEVLSTTLTLVLEMYVHIQVFVVDDVHLDRLVNGCMFDPVK